MQMEKLLNNALVNSQYRRGQMASRWHTQIYQDRESKTSKSDLQYET